jgi:hypothetical protein
VRDSPAQLAKSASNYLPLVSYTLCINDLFDDIALSRYFDLFLCLDPNIIIGSIFEDRSKELKNHRYLPGEVTSRQGIRLVCNHRLQLEFVLLSN